MSRREIKIEYPLSTKSLALVWKLIGSAEGFAKWMADYVEEWDEGYTFIWGEPWTAQEVRKARLLEKVKGKRVRFCWEEDDPSNYFEIRIGASEFSGNLFLEITDHVEEGEEESIRDVWGHDLDKMHSVTGF